MRLLLELARSHPGHTLSMVLCLLVAGGAEALALSSLLPLVTSLAGGSAAGASRLERLVVERMEDLGLEPSAAVLLPIIACAFIAKAGLVLVARSQVGYAVAHVVTRLRLRLVRALLRTRWSFYIQQRIGTFANAFSSEALRASKAYQNATMMVLLGIQLAVYVGVAFATSWRVTLVALVLGLGVVLGLRPLVRMGRRAGVRRTRLFRSLIGTLTDVLQGVKPLKAMAREDLATPIIERDTLRMEKALRKEVFSDEALGAVQEPIIVVIIAAGFYVLREVLGLELSAVVVMGLIVQRTFDNLNRAQRRYHKIAVDESAYWSLIRTVEDAERQREPLAGGAAPTLDEGVELRDVAFRHGEHRVFESLSLRIPAGRITALTGPSGGGKTTLVDLVAGLFEPERGAVLVDGRPLPELDLVAWRGRIGYVPQEMFLLHESIAMNVSLGDPEISREEIEAALRDAHAWEFVSRLPAGIDAVVGERGSALSGGQRQRISIARAMVHRPWLLVLDEATAALDPASEAAVWEALEELRGRTTILAISHQPALLAAADRVYRIAGGRAEEVARGASDASPARAVSAL